MGAVFGSRSLAVDSKREASRVESDEWNHDYVIVGTHSFPRFFDFSTEPSAH